MKYKRTQANKQKSLKNYRKTQPDEGTEQKQPGSKMEPETMK